MRRLLTCAVLAAVTLLLTACSPPKGGLLGLTVRDGRLIVLAASCDSGHPLLDLRIGSDDAEPGFLQQGRYVLPAPVDGLAELDLGPVDDFTAQLDPEAVYSVRAWTEGSSGRAAGPVLRATTPLDDRVLSPGEGGPLEPVSSTVADFAAAACRSPGRAG